MRVTQEPAVRADCKGAGAKNQKDSNKCINWNGFVGIAIKTPNLVRRKNYEANLIALRTA